MRIHGKNIQEIDIQLRGIVVQIGGGLYMIESPTRLHATTLDGLLEKLLKAMKGYPLSGSIVTKPLSGDYISGLFRESPG